MMPLLLTYLFSDRAPAVAQTAGYRLLRWASAFDSWLLERQSTTSPTLLGIARNAWRQLLAFRTKPPWELTPTDILDWVKDLESRNLRPSTINQRLTAISFFYRYCQQHQIDPQPVPDPAHGAPRLKERKYSTSNYLGLDELHALLNAIDKDTSILGKRDYALLLTLLTTALTPDQIRHLRFKDFHSPSLSIHGDKVPSECEGGMGPALSEANVVRAPILDYLTSSGRLPTLQPDDYLFASLADPLKAPAQGKPGDWRSGQPITQALIEFILRQYSRIAGLDPRQVSCRNLRHTAAILRLQAGDDIADIQRFLGRASMQNTASYLDKLASLPKEPLWDENPDPRPLQRGPNRAQPGNLHALVHGFYSTRLPPEDLSALQEEAPTGLDYEIALMRIVIRRTFELSDDATNVAESAHYLDVLGMAATRLAKLFKVRHSLRQVSYHDDTRMQAFLDLAKNLEE
jgi:integrase